MDLLLTKYLKAMISYEGVQRVETYPVPEEALREAVLNAIAHKDYGSGIPVQISVLDYGWYSLSGTSRCQFREPSGKLGRKLGRKFSFVLLPTL